MNSALHPQIKNFSWRPWPSSMAKSLIHKMHAKKLKFNFTIYFPNALQRCTGTRWWKIENDEFSLVNMKLNNQLSWKFQQINQQKGLASIIKKLHKCEFTRIHKQEALQWRGALPYIWEIGLSIDLIFSRQEAHESLIFELLTIALAVKCFKGQTSDRLGPNYVKGGAIILREIHL